MLNNNELWNWRQHVVDGTHDARAVTVVILDRGGHEPLRYELHDAFPVKWEGPDFDASKNEVAIETIELAIEGFNRVGS